MAPANKKKADPPSRSASPSPPPAVAKRARSRGRRRADPPASKTAPAPPVAPPLLPADAGHPAPSAGAFPGWGRQKARGADPVLSGKSVDDSPSPLPRMQRASSGGSADPESVGFESLLQLADAGVQLEKRRRTNAKKPSSVAGKKKAGASASASASKKKSAAAVGNTDAGALKPAGEPKKKRGRGPNKAKESEAEREAKRLRRVQANRESARQTIRRKHELYDDLKVKAGELERSNETLRDELQRVFDEMQALAARNAELRSTLETNAKARGEPAPVVGDGGAAAREAANEPHPQIAVSAAVAGAKTEREAKRTEAERAAELASTDERQRPTSVNPLGPEAAKAAAPGAAPNATRAVAPKTQQQMMFPPGMIPPPGAAAMPAMPIPWGAFAGMFGAPNMNVNVNGRPPNGPPFFGAGVNGAPPVMAPPFFHPVPGFSPWAPMPPAADGGPGVHPQAPFPAAQVMGANGGTSGGSDETAAAAEARRRRREKVSGR